MTILSGYRRQLIALLLMALACAAAPWAHGQTAPDLANQLRQVEGDVRTIEREAEAARDDAQRALLRARLSTAKQSATAAAQQLSGQLTAVDARIAELGPAPAGGAEPPDMRRQRSQITAERLAIDAAVKRARLLEVEADQLSLEIQRAQAEQFGARMSKRVASPITPAFWAAVVRAFSDDMAGIRRFAAPVQGGNLLFVGLGALLAVLLIGPGRSAALRLGQRYLVRDASHRMQRSGYALWVIVVGTAAPVLASLAFVSGAGLSNLTPESWNGLIQGFVAATGFAGFTSAVIGALLMRSQPSWRVAKISDPVAEHLRPLSWILAGMTFVSGVIEAFNTAVGASDAALAASNALEAAGSILLFGGALISLGRIQAARAEKGGGQGAAVGLSVLTLVLWIVVLAALGALLIGFVAFSRFVVGMVVWATVLFAATYLLMKALDDLATGVFSRTSRPGRALIRGVGLRASAIDQFGVLLSGALRLPLGLIALILFLAPFGAGSGVESTLRKIASAAEAIEVGGVAVSPGAILRGLLVLVVGMALVRAFMGWLEKRYLPATDLDGSGRNSISLIARYVGVAVAVIWALASLGIGIERVALLLSALSVGIGFGLQAITQNFISGLILLAERPIKIGDLIKVGADEGDVKRISVRSTEIRLPDHSTLIIPNSELITKSVLNKTLASAMGRLQIQFSIPIEADAARVERILLDVYESEAAILREPAPSVFIDSIADGRIVFNSFAHVPNPRAAYGARSNVFKTLMRRLREEGVDLGSAPQKLELMAPAEALGPPPGPRKPPKSG